MIGSEVKFKTKDYKDNTSENGIATMIITWKHGMQANSAGFKALKSGGNAMDMIEAAARIVEEDAEGLSVGLGGLPDREGNVTLDACCMDHKGRAGSVVSSRHYVSAICCQKSNGRNTSVCLRVKEQNNLL